MQHVLTPKWQSKTKTMKRALKGSVELQGNTQLEDDCLRVCRYEQPLSHRIGICSIVNINS